MTAPLLYYVAIHNADRSMLLAGPYPTEAEAEAVKDVAHDMACKVDPFAWFHTVSLARSPERLRTRFGLVTGQERSR